VNIAPLVSLRQERSISPETFEAALDAASHGASVLSIAERFDVPRSTLRDRLNAHASLDLPDSIKNALASPGGQEFLARFSIALHVHVRNVCACGLRVIGNVLKDSGLATFLGASVASQWEAGRAIDEAIVAYGHAQNERIAPALKDKEITLALDEKGYFFSRQKRLSLSQNK
jgi:hypothetical protein